MIRTIEDLTEDEIIMSEFADVMDDLVDHILDEEAELEDEAIEEFMNYGCQDDADIILDQDLEEHPLTEEEINEPWNEAVLKVNVYADEEELI